MKQKYILTVIVFLSYFFLAALTLGDYNISWDEPTHFKRGQAYLHYFLTGKTTYEGLPNYDLKRARQDSSYHERSLYQEEGFDAQYHFQKDGDHPVLNDILAALSNYVFYQKLGWMGDVESYHLFEIFTSAVLVGITFLFAYEAFGVAAGIFSAIFLSTYPLFWAESHFNIKDPIEATFFALAVYFIWKSVRLRKVHPLFISALFAGGALGTKLNIAFLPFIIVPWLLYIMLKNREIRQFILQKSFIFAFILIPIIAYFIFAVSWPWLWQDLFKNTLSVLGYYKDIGTEIRSWNFTPLKWVIYGTQPLVLIFFLIGAIASLKHKDKNNTIFLALLWFFIPIFRVTVPNTSIYGGARQIMEYIPAMAIVAGFGASYASQLFKRYANLLVVFTFIVLVLSLIRLHPNENVYLNGFIGGLPGAMKAKFPSAGFSFGNAYLQGLTWLNKNAPEGSKLALIQGTVLNIPSLKIRPDIEYSNAHWSGIERKGEYLIELTYNYELKFFPYAWEYVEKMLDPVYEVKVDGISIATIWKNDLEHSKDEFRKNESVITSGFGVGVRGNVLEISSPNEITLTRLVVSYDSQKDCSASGSGYIETSLDGATFLREKESTTEEQISGVKAVDGKRLIHFFAARKLKNIKVVLDSGNSCVLNSPKATLYVLK